MKTALWWVRSDLRLSDNQALATAVAQAERVVPVYLFESARLDGSDVNEKRLAFLLGGLSALDEDLRAVGIDLSANVYWKHVTVEQPKLSCLDGVDHQS